MTSEAPNEEALELLDEEFDTAMAGEAVGRDRTRRIKMQREKMRLPYFALYYY